MIPTNRRAGDRDAPDAGEYPSAFALAGGEMAALIGSADWAATGIGSPENWPSSLMTVLRILVTSRYQMWMAWGQDLTFFYNDAYAPTLGVKHPRALGRPAREVWREIWPDIGPRIESVLQTGHATWDEALLLFLERSGYPEETYHTFSYSPLPDDNGAIAGMLCVVMEETQRVIGERRVATLRDLASELGAVRSEPDVLEAVERSLARNTRDIAVQPDLPGGRRHRPSAARNRLRRHRRRSGAGSGRAGLRCPGRPAASSPGTTNACCTTISGVPNLPMGAWDTPPRQVVVVPIVQQGEKQQAGLFIAGLNPYRPFDEAYAGFIDLVAAQIASGLAAARAYEAERRRAEALAEIDAAKTAFFSNVSHEFRTPLTLMLGPLEEEIAARPDQAAADRLEMVHRNGLRLLRLVNTPAGFLPHRGRAGAGALPAAGTGPLYRRTGQQFPLRLRTRRAAAGNLLRCAAASGLCRPGDVGTYCPQSRLECIQVYSGRRNLRRPDRRAGGRRSGADRARHRHRHSRRRNCRTSSTASTGSRARTAAPWRAPASASRWSTSWSACTAARSASKAEIGAGTTFAVRIPFGHAHLPAGPGV